MTEDIGEEELLKLVNLDNRVKRRLADKNRMQEDEVIIRKKEGKSKHYLGFSFSEAEKITMWEEQRGICPGCNQNLPYDKAVNHHIHGTHLVVAQMHLVCNSSVGKLGDIAENLFAMAIRMNEAEVRALDKLENPTLLDYRYDTLSKHARFKAQ